MEEIVSLGITKYELIFIITSSLLFGHLIWNIQKRLEGPNLKEKMKDSSVVYVDGKNLLRSIDEFQENMLNSK